MAAPHLASLQSAGCDHRAGAVNAGSLCGERGAADDLDTDVGVDSVVSLCVHVKFVKKSSAGNCLDMRIGRHSVGR